MVSAPGLAVPGLLPTVTWAWSWVPPVGDDDVEARTWEADVAAMFDAWTADSRAALTHGLPPELRGLAAPGSVGAEVTAWLRSRTVDLSPQTHVVWGAAFLTPERPRWAPVVAVVELSEPRADDAGYLMDVVGTRGRPDDARPPVVEYVTTDGGDGVRVTALTRGTHGEASVRVDAALRLDATAVRGPLDVVVATRVHELGLFGLAGPGIDQLLHAIAAEGTATTAPVPSSTTGRTP